MMSKDLISTLRKETVLNGYEMNLSMKESILLIEAEKISTCKLYSVRIDKNEIPKLTGELFSDLEAFYESLIDGINKTDNTIKVFMTEDAILNYSFETSLGKRKKRFEFSIALKEVELNSITIIQRNNDKLKSIIYQKDQRISQLEQEYIHLIKTQSLEIDKQTENKLATEIEKQTQTLESRISSEIEKHFNIKLESAIEKQTINIETRMVSELEKQTQLINNRLESLIDNQLETTLGLKIEKLSKTLEMTQELQIEKIAKTLESKLGIQNEDLNLETKQDKQLAIEKEPQIFKKLLADYYEKIKIALENDIGKLTQTMKTWLSDHIKNNTNTCVNCEFKKQMVNSDGSHIQNIERLNINKQILHKFDAKMVDSENILLQDILRLKINEQILHKFDAKSVNSNMFIYCNDNQTIIYKGRYSSMITIDSSLPKKETTFNFRIERTKNNYIMIGICPFSILSKIGSCYNSMGACAYYGLYGQIYCNSSNLKSNGGVFKKGSIIRMTVNLLEFNIEWMQDNKLMHRMNIDKSYVNQEMYACLHIYDEDDCVSLLNY